ncbi:MAG TPA: zinc-binding dehydrogenase [Candidatus Binatia bacterium]|nr:zinc-binding dehydrogenase [Candidatus Binatia bacterium]
MKAIEVEAPGGVEALRLVDLPEPAPGPGEVALAVAYAAVNWGDTQKRAGIYPDPVPYPAVLGMEVAGIVAALGTGVRDLRTGDRVAALCGPRLLGGYAETVVVPRPYVLCVPATMSLETAAAMPLAGLTAYHLLHSAYRLRRGETVLVHAAAGSVGQAVCQVASAVGARVIGTVGRADKVAAARMAGAEVVIDRSREDFVEVALEATGGRGVDLVIDSLGGEILPRSFDALRIYGHLINIGEAAGEPNFPIRKKLYERSTSMAGFEVLHAEPGSTRWRRGVRFVERLMGAGLLRIPIAAVLSLDEAAAAHALLEGRGTAGKVLLRVRGDSAG